MYEFLSLKVQCPVCGVSLMDNKQLVDNESSIHLNLEIESRQGSIWLSSVYGSYNNISDIDLPAGKIARFFCPHCKTQITSAEECLTCGAHMVPFLLDMGGKVSICSRSGCKNHFVEFEDLSIAMKKLYQEYGFRGKDVWEPSGIPAAPKKVDEKKEIIESGTFLQSYCPHCRKSLIEDNMLKVKISDARETGILMLSPYLNIFTSKSTIFLEEEKVIKDLQCPHCDHSLIETEKRCGKCNSPIARINVSTTTKLIDFYICTKKGCRWHGLSEEDLYEIRLQDSAEW